VRETGEWVDPSELGEGAAVNEPVLSMDFYYETFNGRKILRGKATGGTESIVVMMTMVSENTYHITLLTPFVIPPPPVIPPPAPRAKKRPTARPGKNKP
jgi:hypothetical protein